jgi:ABC-type transport system involved in cytochrome bd biosynthesis fused ATPase/permease subunit
LIGRLGAGKSTTTHFLAGSEMEKTEIYFDG